MHLFQEEAETKLYESITKNKQNLRDYVAIHIILSSHKDGLPEYMIGLFTNLFHALLNSYQGGIFLCVDQDIILLIKDIDHRELAGLKSQIRGWLVEEHIADNLNAASFFIHVYFLSFNYDDFLDVTKNKLQSAKQHKAKTIHHDSFYERINSSLKTMKLLGEKLFDLPIEKFIRQQKIYFYSPSHKANSEPLFAETFISLRHLCEQHKLDSEALRDKSAFWYIMGLLDYKMLEELQSNYQEYISDLPISINLSISSIFTEHFHKFNSTLPEEYRCKIIIEFNISEIFSDFLLYTTAVNYLRQLGYKICIDQVTLHLTEKIHHQDLNADLIKINWDQDHQDSLAPEKLEKLKNDVATRTRSRIILCHCSNEKAVDFGEKLGILLYQGWHFDDLEKANENNKKDSNGTKNNQNNS